MSFYIMIQMGKGFMARPKGSKNRKSGGKTAGKKNTRRTEVKNEPLMGDEVAIIVTFAIAMLLLLSNFGLCGPIGAAFRGLQLGLFGTIGYIFPLVLLFAVVFLLSNADNAHAVLKMTAALFMLVFFSGILALCTGYGVEGMSLWEFFEAGAEGTLGGGAVGGALGLLLHTIFGQVGAVLLLLVAILICLVYITEKPLMRMLAKGSISAAGRAGERAREDFEQLSASARSYRDARSREREKKQAEAAERRRREEMDAGLDLPLAGKHTDSKGKSARLERAEVPESLGIDLPLNNAHSDGRISKAELLKRRQETADERPEKAEPAEILTIEHAKKRTAAAKEAFQEILDQSSTFTGRINGAYSAAEARTETETEADAETEVLPAEEDNVFGPENGMSGIETETAPVPEAEAEPVLPDEAELMPWRTEADEAAEIASRDDVVPEDTEAEEADFTEYHAPAAEEAQMPAYGAPEEAAETAAAEAATDPDERVLRADETGNGTRRVVTSNGKIIDSDVEDVRKRVEQKRVAAATDAENASVKQQIEAQQKPKRPYRFPPLSLLEQGGAQDTDTREEIERNAITLQQTLKSFGVGVTVTDVSVGPAVTRYELQPEQGVKVSKIVALTNDIKMRLAAADIRIEAPIPGKSAVGIEVPNKKGQVVYLGDVLNSREFQEAKAKLAFGVGKDIAGKIVVTDIAKMPHLLIAGATGSGKSVSINTLVMSIIYKYKPEDVRMIMVDPKVVELQVYNGIPHLLIPVVTDPKKAAAALNWAVAEMQERYRKFAATGARDLQRYNEKIEAVRRDPSVPEKDKPEKLPQIVIIIDELADLMMVSAQEVEDAICRLAQLARACGMHLVIATQRPSVNVITGLIKANVPSRIAFAVSSGVDSRTIIDMNGAEKLLGKGDMLFFPQGIPKPVRVQGAFVSDQEVQAVVDFLKENTDADYNESIKSTLESPGSGEGSGGADTDELFTEAGRLIVESEKASIGLLQRKFRIGFNRAARIMDQLADAGVVGPEEGTKPRRILMSVEEFDELFS